MGSFDSATLWVPSQRHITPDLREQSTASPPVNPFGVGRWCALDWQLAGAGGGVGRRAYSALD